MTTPDVSVIIGAYNAMPYLSRCVTSVVTQSIGERRMEIITIDDGSTDGTGDELDRFAKEHPELFTVIHQKNSGGPAGPRNVGLDLARGRYVFFLDADDYLGDEALERMVTMADAQESDVVLGKMVGVGGRSAPTLAYKQHLERTDVFSSAVYWNLTVMKLFRRDLIERLRLRFPPELKLRQDQPFCAMAYIHAANISVINDYDCVYWVHRDDGDNISRRIKGTAYRVRALEIMFELLGAEIPAGPPRDQLMYRHLVTEFRAILSLLREEEMQDVTRQGLFDDLKRLLRRWHSDALFARLPAVRRLQYELVRNGTLDQLRTAQDYVSDMRVRNGQIFMRNGESLRPDRVIIENGRAYAAGYPFFRESSAGIRDSAYDYTRELAVTHRLHTMECDGYRLQIAGHVALPDVESTDLSVSILVCERSSKSEHALTVKQSSSGEATRTDFSASGELGTLAAGRELTPGLWDVFVEVRANGLVKRARVGHARSEALASVPQQRVLRTKTAGSTPVALYYTAKHGNLTLDIGGAKHPPLADVAVREVSWAPGTSPFLRVTGEITCEYPPGTLRLVGTRQGASPVHAEIEVTSGHRRTFSAAIPLAATAGEWTFSIRHEDNGHVTEIPVEERELPVRRWRRRGVTWYAKSLRAPQTMTLRVARISLARALGRRLKG